MHINIVKCICLLPLGFTMKLNKALNVRPLIDIFVNEAGSEYSEGNVFIVRKSINFRSRCDSEQLRLIVLGWLVYHTLLLK